MTHFDCRVSLFDFNWLFGRGMRRNYFMFNVSDWLRVIFKIYRSCMQTLRVPFNFFFIGIYVLSRCDVACLFLLRIFGGLNFSFFVERTVMNRGWALRMTRRMVLKLLEILQLNLLGLHHFFLMFFMMDCILKVILRWCYSNIKLFSTDYFLFSFNMLMMDR